METIEFLRLRIKALEQELIKKDAIIAKKEERLIQSLKYVNQYVETLEVIQSEL